MTRRTALIAVLVSGVVFAATYLTFSSGPNLDAIAIVTEPAVRIPLDGLRASRPASIVFTVPRTQMWQDFQDEWGEPPYIVFAYSGRNTRTIQPLSGLGLDIRVTEGGQPLTVTPGRSMPYLYSLLRNDAPFLTLTFAANPGTEVRVDITAADPALLPDGELRVEPLWRNGDLKDVLVGSMLAEDRRTKLLLSSLTAVIAGALVIGSRRRGRRSTQEKS